MEALPCLESCLASRALLVSVLTTPPPPMLHQVPFGGTLGSALCPGHVLLGAAAERCTLCQRGLPLEQWALWQVECVCGGGAEG